ncbi:MAG: hypothetical protein KJ561_00870 [Nanoarchaeota archaeon]|nr:hypothetical protein [Nanoarchaeota archaeon]
MRKAQGGLNAAVLVAIIAAIIVIYILFLPTEDRKDLLEDTSGSSGTSSSSPDSISLLSENVGRLDPVGNVKDKDIPNVMIFETTNSKVLEYLNPISIRNGWFDKRSKTVQVTLDNYENIDNVALSFSAPKRQGILSITFNGNLLYEYDINNINIEPIKIKKSLLQKDNELGFSVSGVGTKFWSTNEYALEDVKLIGDITDLSRQESKNTFTLTDTEYQNLEKTTMKFIPYCTSSANVGVLDVFVNDRNIFSAVPVCNDRYSQEIPLSALSAGQNKIIFKTSKGSYSIEQVKLSFTEKDTPEAVYYFEVNSTTIKKITDNDYDAFLRLRFVDEENTKRADLNINDHLMRIDQTKKLYEKNINSWLEEGNNFIKITPKTTLDISEINVELEKK